MIIDFHTHTFPEKIAAAALSKLSASSHTCYYNNGTNSTIRESMTTAGVDYSVILPVVTSPSQHNTVNNLAATVNDNFRETGLISFGGIHPDNEDYRDIIKNLAARNIKGIKLHPVYQLVNFDDIRYMRIIECACEYGMIVVTHAGYDISFPLYDQVTPKRIKKVIDTIKPDKLVLAHMGGWECWNEVFEILTTENVWFDTSYSITPIRLENKTDLSPVNEHQLSSKDFCSLVRKIGVEKILFGSDNPWSDQLESLKVLRSSGLTEDELKLIEGENAKKLLNL